jgi:hypothetical protein
MLFFSGGTFSIFAPTDLRVSFIERIWLYSHILSFMVSTKIPDQPDMQRVDVLLPWSVNHRSLLEQANAEDSDVLMVSYSTVPGEFGIQPYPDGTFDLLNDDYSEQTLSYMLWRRSVNRWEGPQNTTLAPDRDA